MGKRSRQRNRHERAEPPELAYKLEMPATLPQRSEGELLAQVAQVVERTQEDGAPSRQPRFSATSNALLSAYRYVKLATLDEPGARASAREWDKWYREFVPGEPLLNGVLNSVVQIDKNRGWTLTGGRNQVGRYLRVLHAADDNAGWRPYLDWQAQSFYLTSMGLVTEIGRDGDGGPLRALWSVDPTRCELTGNVEAPLKYFPRLGGVQEWLPGDFFRAAAFVSTDEAALGRGKPAVARAYELAKIMVAVWEHDKEQLGARAPRGLLLLHGITQEQWNDAMQARDEQLDAYEREYYGAVAVLASAGVEEVQAQLVALSNLPKDWNLETWTNILMYGYALVFGYDPREFWPVSGGQLGTAKESEVQHRKATSKGDLDFSLAHQAQLQKELPSALQFEYEQRDVEGEVADTTAALTRAQLISEMNKWVIAGETVLSREQLLQLAAEARLIPQEWTPQEEQVQGTDAELELQRTLALPRVQRACEMFPDEPIVQYASKTGRTRVLWQRGGDAVKRRAFPLAGWRDREIESGRAGETDDVRVLRAFGYELPLTLRTVKDVTREYDQQLTKFVNMAFDGDMNAVDMARAHRALLRTLGPRSYAEGMREGGVDPDASEDGIDSEDQAALDEWVANQLQYVREFAKAAVDADGDTTKRVDVLARVLTWIDAMSSLGAQGKMSAQKNAMGTWQFGDTEDHCDSCARLNGQRHRVKWFRSKGYIPREPGSETLECGGWSCDCRIAGDDGRRLI